MLSISKNLERLTEEERTALATERASLEGYENRLRTLDEELVSLRNRLRTLQSDISDMALAAKSTRQAIQDSELIIDALECYAETFKV